MLMEILKPLDLFGDGIGEEMYTDSSSMSTQGETTNEIVNNEDGIEASNEIVNNEDGIEASNEIVNNEDETETSNENASFVDDNENSSSGKECSEVMSDVDGHDTDECTGDLNSNENVDGLMAKIEPLFQSLSNQISDMETLFNKRIMHADYEDKVIDQMHSELCKYKEDLYSQLVRPILLDIIDVRDSIIRIASKYLENPEGKQDIPNKTFAEYAYDLQDILEKNNVEVYRSERGGTFVPVRQRAIKKEVTNDESLDRKIAESFSSGYSYEGRVISAEKVSVYFFEKADENQKESEEN